MKIAFQTIIYGPTLPDLENVLKFVSECGFQGIEFAQRPEFLGNTSQLSELSQLYNVKIIGLAGGTYEERKIYCKDIIKPNYFYTDNWDEKDYLDAIENKLTLAIHPHMYKSVQRFSEIQELLGNYPELKFILDTAHLTIAGEDIIDVYRATKNKIAAIHLKDWTQKYGRSSIRYGRGFVELGNGDVKIDELLNELRITNYYGWIVLEQDRTDIDPIDSINKSIDWLVHRGWNLKRIENKNKFVHENNETNFQEGYHQSRITGILYESAMRYPSKFFSILADTIYEHFRCELVTVWTCSPANDIINLIAITPNSFEPKINTLKISKSLSSLTIKRQSITEFDLTEPSNRQNFGHPELLDLIKTNRMISIPILNPDNSNHVQLLINIFPDIDVSIINKKELFAIGLVVAKAARIVLEDKCLMATSTINYFAGKCKDLKKFLSAVIDVIKDILSIEGTSILLVDEFGEKLNVIASSGIEWNVPEDDQYYSCDDSYMTGSVWKNKEPLIIIDALKAKRFKIKSYEKVTTVNEFSYLIFPFFNSNNQMVGVIRCRNKKFDNLSGNVNTFSDYDVAIIDAICQSMLPHLLVLQEEDNRFKIVSKLTHELKVPIVAIRGAAQLMQNELKNKTVFTYDYIEDIWSYSEIMRRQLGTFDSIRFKMEALKPQFSWIYLKGEIVAPAVRQVNPLIRERNFNIKKIEYDNFSDIPKLWIDRSYFQQVVFNLLSNSIKFAFDDPSSFHIVFESDKTDDHFIIIVKDWGKGIDRGYEKRIFDEGFRGPNSENDVVGQGLGLWFVKQILTMHGGTIEVTNNCFPTTFMIKLPREIAQKKL